MHAASKQYVGVKQLQSREDQAANHDFWHRGIAIGVVSAAFAACAGLALVSLLLARAQWHLTAACVVVAGAWIIVAAALHYFHARSKRHIAKLRQDADMAEQARLAAETAVREKSRVLALMSHEIRTPLNGVIGMMNLLLETELSGEQRNYTQTAHVSSRALMSIVDEILDRAKSEATRPATPQAVHLRRLVEGVTELLAPRAHGKQIDISSYVDPSIPATITIDEAALRQILFNLVGNAIKFTDKGGVAIALLRDGTDALAITVKDTGIGLSPEEAARIFDDYQQATAETARHYGGTGLGLGITKAFAESMGGTISLTSMPGQGSCFTVSLPVALPPLLPINVTLPLAGRSFTLAMAATPSAEHLARNISDLGGHISFCRGDKELAELLAKASSMTIIADTCHADTLRKWKSGSRRRGNVWIVLTAEERRPYRDLIGAPFAGYLLKPMRQNSLLSRLAHTDTRRLAEAARQLRDVSQKAKPSQALNILVADDNPINLMLTGTLLAKNGHRVQTVSSGRAVLDLLVGAHGFDILLLDAEMPDLDGYETARAIRDMEVQHKQRKHLPILGLTAHVRPEELQKCIASGMNDYLSKPFDSQDLAESLAKLVRRSAA